MNVAQPRQPFDTRSLLLKKNHNYLIVIKLVKEYKSTFTRVKHHKKYVQSKKNRLFESCFIFLYLSKRKKKKKPDDMPKFKNKITF